MLEFLKKLFDITALQDALNPSIFTWNSLEGILVILFIVGIVLHFGKKVKNIIMSGFMFMIFLEMMHILAMSSVGDRFTILQTIFAYDTIQSLAQLCVGTPICTLLLYLQAFLNNTFGQAIEVMWQLFWLFWDTIGASIVDSIETFMGLK